MNSIVISFLTILFSVLMFGEINLISLVSLLFLVFILNVFIVSKIVSKCKQNDPKVHSNELKSNQIINNNFNYYYYYYNSVIYYMKRPFIKLFEICLDYISNKVSNYLLEVEKTLSQKPFCGNLLDIKNEFNVISHLITDNYVKFWYQSIGTDNIDFENDCQLILQKMFLNLFERCEQKIDKQKFCQKFLILLESHLNETKCVEQLSSVDLNENQRIDVIIERVFRLTATEDIKYVLSFRTSAQKAKDLSLVLMIKAMLSHSVFLPIVDIITEQKFIYENLFYLVTNSELKLIDKIKNEYQLKNTNQINEPFLHEFKDQIQTIDTTDKTQRITSEEFYDKKLFKQISNDSEEDKIFDLTDFSGNESNDELIIEAMEAEEEEIEEKLISNIVLTKTEEITEPYVSTYILYFIEYDGLFHPTIDSQITSDSSNQRICLLRRRFLVQRRFSEFISLQKVLERNKTFKRLMRGIKKPTSIQITAQNLLAFAGSANTRLDSSTVEFRRIYLQNFINQLSNLKAIAESPEFLQFLAYGSDGRIAFVGSNANNNLSLNIDRVFYRGFKGAMSIMKSAFPVEPQTGKIDPKFSERVIPENEKLTIKSIATNFESNNWMQLEKKLNIWSQTDSDLSFIESLGPNVDNILTANSDKDFNSENIHLKSSGLGARTLGDGCEDPKFNELNPVPISNNKTTYQLNFSPAFHSINCFLLFITKNMGLIGKIFYTKIISLIFETTIERFITELVSKLVTKETFVRNIHSLHLALWPTNESKVQNECEVQTTDCIDQTVDAFYCYLKSRIYSLSPHISFVLDKLSVQQFLANILVKFKDRNKNKLFLYEFCELILDEIE